MAILNILFVELLLPQERKLEALTLSDLSRFVTDEIKVIASYR